MPDNGAQPNPERHADRLEHDFPVSPAGLSLTEVELNYTCWPNGDRSGINQLYATPGLIVGRFKIHNRIGLTVGAGLQIPVTQGAQDGCEIVLTARVPFWFELKTELTNP